MNNYKIPRRMGLHARFSHLFPSDTLRDNACPYLSAGPLRKAWMEGWMEGEKVLAPLEEHRKALLELTTTGLHDHLPVTLMSFGRNKIAVIKAVRSITGLGLKEAKQLVESAPARIGVFTEMEAADVAAQLREAGAEVQQPSALERLAALSEEG